MSEKALREWVQKQLSVPDDKHMAWQPLSGDASFRRYFRCQWQGQSYIVALAPPQTEKNHEFVSISVLLKRSSIKASEVLAVDYDHGYLLQYDIGSTLLADVLNPESVDQYYQQALAQLIQMQKIPASDRQMLAAYDAEALQLELSYFTEWFVLKLLQYQTDTQEVKLIQDFFDELISSAQQQPQGFVHRDYHCRNIMLNSSDELVCIDFQDALNGPLSYDVVSLLRDCYVVWPQQQVKHYLHHFWQSLQREQLIDASFDFNAMQVAFDLMGLQRHIKVLGVFARLSLRDQKHSYLKDLSTVVHYVRQVLASTLIQSDARDAFQRWFDEALMPLIVQQPWYTAEESV